MKDVAGERISYEYDSYRRLRQGTNKEGTIEIKYDSIGRPTEISYPNGHSLSYGYDSQDKRTFIADNNGYNVTYVYDGRNRLTEIHQSVSGELIVEYQYNERNEVVRKTLGNGAYTTYQYKGRNGQLSEVRNFLPSGEASSYFLYEFDKRGRLISMTSESGVWTYSYDPNGQLVKWATPEGDATEHTYDSRGNRLVQIRSGRQESYSTNSVNQYLEFNETESFFYDANGHLRQKIARGRTESFVFSAEGRLVETETPDIR